MYRFIGVLVVLVVLGLAVFLGVSLWRENRQKTIDQAAEWVMKRQGKYENEDRGGTRCVAKVYLINRGLTDDELDHLLPLTTLKYLNLSSNAITDGGLEKLKGFKELEVLYLGATEITDEGLKVLRHFPHLRELGLDGNGAITDKGLKHLEGNPSLKYIGLTSTGVSDAGIAALEKTLPQATVAKLNRD